MRQFMVEIKSLDDSWRGDEDEKTYLCFMYSQTL